MNAIFLTSLFTVAFGFAQIAGIPNTAPRDLPQYAEAMIPAISSPKTPFLSIQEYARAAAEEADLNPDQFIKLVACESSWNPDALGDGGKSTGLLQFQKRTFNEFVKKYDVHYLFIENPHHQIDLAVRMLQAGRGIHWQRCAARAGFPIFRN